MVELIDTHTHIYDTNDFGDEHEAIIKRLTEAGVSQAILPNIDSKSLPDVLLFESYAPERFHPLIGLHPENVNESWKSELDGLLGQMGSHRFYGIGEVGIDLYWEDKYKAEQIECFTEQVAVSVEKGLPIIIHCRNGLKETLDCLRKFDKKKVRGIFHSFTGTKDEAEEIKNTGNFRFGINGIVTFKKSTDLQAVVKEMPLEELVVETDSPYLTPVPFRGQRNETAYIKYVAEKIAEIKGIGLDQVGEVTTKNAKEIFGI